jgi:hypothetical protein
VLATNSSVFAQQEESGEFVVRSAATKLIGGTYYVSADIDLNLSTEAAGMLREAVPLTIRIEVEFLNRLRFWMDVTEFEVVRRYRLTYLPVRNRYLVRDVDGDLSRNFIDLQDALDFIGKVERLEIVDEAELDEDRRYEVRIRAVLDKRDLPGWLRLIAVWRKDWTIGSDWLTWRLDSE